MSTQEIQVQELEDWLKQETEKILSPLRKEAEKLVENLKTRLEDVKTTCKAAMVESEEEVKAGKKPRKARAMYKLARYFLQLAEGMPLPKDVSFEVLAKLDGELERSLNAIVRQRAIWYPLISPMFMISRRKLDLTLDRMASTARELHGFMADKYSKVKTIEETFARIKKTQRLRDELTRIKAEKEETELEIRDLDAKIEENKKRMELIQSTQELTNLAIAKDKIKELDKNVKHSLRHLQKPFKKLQQLTQNVKAASMGINVQKLNDYLSKPFAALATEEEAYPALKRILQELNTAMEQGKLKLKPTRVRKAQEDIAKILNENMLNQLQLECKEALSQLQALQSSEAVASLKNEYSGLQESLSESQKNREIQNTRLASQRNEHKEKLEETLAQKTEIEKNIQKTLGENIKIIL